jgi:hypothetical protein
VVAGLPIPRKNPFLQERLCRHAPTLLKIFHMNKYCYKDAKSLVQSVCSAAKDGMFDTREKFLTMLTANPDIAAREYNVFGKPFFWNDASVALYGYREEEAVNRDIFDTILPVEMR